MEQNQSAKEHLFFLCEKIANRCVGSTGNLEATGYFRDQLKKWGWRLETQEFDAFDWSPEHAFISFNNRQIKVNPSPNSQTGIVEGETITVSKIEELDGLNAKGKILIVKDALAAEPLMPKNFVFYNPEHHKKIISHIEKSRAEALIFIVNKNGGHGGGEYPFPIIEDGDFLIPSVFLSVENDNKIISEKPERIGFVSKTTITPSKGFNVIGRKGRSGAKKITVTAHIDSKRGSPGAIDNATGVACLLLLAEKMKDYQAPYQLELIALNGEDYYSVPGQMAYLESKKMDFSDIFLNINIDGVGLNRGGTAVSFFDLPKECLIAAESMVANTAKMMEGIQWFQGDHSLFLQNGVPAIAITSNRLLTNGESQDITHTKNDNLSIVEIDRITELAIALSSFIANLSYRV